MVAGSPAAPARHAPWWPPCLCDVDGTLVDSTNVVNAVWRQVAAEFGADAVAILATCHGRRDLDVAAEFFPPGQAGAVVARVAELEVARAGDVRAIPGALELLTRLDPRRWAVVTSGSRALMSARLAGAGLPVPAVIMGADDVRAGKPDPEGYLAAAAALGVPATACVVVEDSPAGVAAGRSAGAFVVAVTTTHPASDLTAADVVIDDLAGLRPAVLDRFRRS